MVLRRDIRYMGPAVVAVCRPSLAPDTGRLGLAGAVCLRMNDGGSSCMIASEEVSGVDCRHQTEFLRELKVFEALSLSLGAGVGPRVSLPDSLPLSCAAFEDSMTVELKSSQSKV